MSLWIKVDVRTSDQIQAASSLLHRNPTKPYFKEGIKNCQISQTNLHIFKNKNRCLLDTFPDTGTSSTFLSRSKSSISSESASTSPLKDPLRLGKALKTKASKRCSSAEGPEKSGRLLGLPTITGSHARLDLIGWFATKGRS